ncbi:hypothetical protein CHLNCDRAFT_144219 [Chlorella variabilis]|uniref:Uncharacterized protein n=1 Tax=Chlorella variabilis TaxID=554065 RepID=E1ZC68_CHLVA|nr:hypothetical protein CHLNCDRAFT_144219 [Chlorella variabilis]EFN56757.1 hypothetical protein CHLNCDRAFT_144219 [Chlorella variabilis]|eukprot:XP_005848859.1 hypothetical protein CHLNCDRAFT_144219 [Chlorella variabilis]
MDVPTVSWGRRSRRLEMLLGLVVLLIAPYGGAGARVLQAEGAAAGGDTGGPPPPRPSTANCSELFYEEQQTNNVSGKPTWRQRYFLCDQYWDREDPYAPIFFYAGNEGNVANGVNNTGLMWERAQAFGALLVFAEHRYYGNSWPFGKEESLTLEGLQFLSMEQAIEDYVTFLNWLKISLNATSAPVVAFGGSYGGVLVAIMRATRPSSVQAAVSSSAPMRGWLLQDGGYDPGSYWEVVTRDASPAAGADPACVPNSQRLFPLIISLIESGKEASWRQVEQGLRICPGAINSSGDATMCEGHDG